MRVPNKFHKEKHRDIFFFLGKENNIFFSAHDQPYEFGKNANSRQVDVCGNIRMLFLKFVWRQWELAFFGAATSVVALFIFSGIIFIKGA